MNVEKRNFDEDAAAWDEHPARIKLAQDIADAIQSKRVLRSYMDIMDFGCGTGLLTLQLQPLVHSIVGIDSSQGMLDVFNAKIEKLKLANIRSVLVQYERGYSLIEKYHAIVSSMTLHHVKDIRPLVQQFYDTLLPSGFLCIADLDLDDGRFHDDNTGVFHFGFDRKKLRNIFKEAGFDSIQDIRAAVVVKPTRNGEMKSFAVFLMTGQKKSHEPT